MCEPAGSEPDHPLLSQIVDEELATVAALASIEVLAVNAYAMARHAAGSGLVGAVPPALAQYLGAALHHHEVALELWNGALARRGRPLATRAPEPLARTVNDELASATDPDGVAGVVLRLEEAVAATYQDGLADLESGAGALLAGSILSIDRQHIAVLLFMAGRYSVPEALATV